MNKQVLPVKIVNQKDLQPFTNDCSTLKIIIISLCIFLQLAVVLFAQSHIKLPPVVIPNFRKDTFDIVKFAAIQDGNTLNTKYITDAINACKTYQNYQAAENLVNWLLKQTGNKNRICSYQKKHYQT